MNNTDLTEICLKILNDFNTNPYKSNDKWVYLIYPVSILIQQEPPKKLSLEDNIKIVNYIYPYVKTYLIEFLQSTQGYGIFFLCEGYYTLWLYVTKCLGEHSWIKWDKKEFLDNAPLEFIINTSENKIWGKPIKLIEQSNELIESFNNTKL
jgi:hypothetical protein